MSKYLSTQDFLANLANQEQDYDCPGLGLVRLRGLTLGEVHRLRVKYTGNGTDNIQAMQVEAITTALVQPKLSDAHAVALVDGSAAVVLTLFNEIARRSGMDDDVKNEPGGGS